MMKCKICGNFDESNTAYCIKCGRSPHELVKNEIEIAKENIKEKHVYHSDIIISLKINVHKETCERFLEFLEDLEKQWESARLYKIKNKIMEIQEAINEYVKNE